MAKGKYKIDATGYADPNVEGYLVGKYLGVRKAEGDRGKGFTWTIDHIPSGKRVAQFARKGDAMMVAKALKANVSSADLGSQYNVVPGIQKNPDFYAWFLEARSLGRIGQKPKPWGAASARAPIKVKTKAIKKGAYSLGPGVKDIPRFEGDTILAGTKYLVFRSGKQVATIYEHPSRYKGGIASVSMTKIAWAGPRPTNVMSADAALFHDFTSKHKTAEKVFPEVIARVEKIRAWRAQREKPTSPQTKRILITEAQRRALKIVQKMGAADEPHLRSVNKISQKTINALKKAGWVEKTKFGLEVTDAGTAKLKKRDVDDARVTREASEMREKQTKWIAGGGLERSSRSSVSGPIFSAANAKLARIKSGETRVFEVGGKKYEVTIRPDKRLGYGDTLVTTEPPISSKSYERIEVNMALVAPDERGYRWVGSKSKKGYANVASAIYAMLVEAPKGRLRVALKVRAVKARVRKSGTKWLLKMGKGEALFSTKREAQKLADALNDMTPSEAREAMGL